jgi:hypothetical protein
VWQYGYGVIYAVFASLKGLVPAVRSFIDFLVREMPEKASALSGRNAP